MNKCRIIVLTLTLNFIFFFQSGFAGQSVDNQIFTQLLQQYVIDDRVDYAGFKKDERKLDQYLDILSQTDIDQLSANGQYAFYINAYNAFTIKLILTKYPDLKSIKDLGSFFSSPWKIKFIPLQGKKVHLDYIEHEVLRPTFKDARVHFAVNCASISCPPLLNRAFEEETLDQQLNEQTTLFINGEGNTEIRGSTLYVSKIFKWFKEDFNNDPASFVKKFAQGPLKAKLESLGADISVKYLDYDWGLNN